MGEKVALIIGATGLVGKELLQILLNSNHYKHVIAVVRRELSIDHPKLIMKKVDFTYLEDVLKGIKIDDVFCCIGTTIKKANTKEEMYKVDVEYPLIIANTVHQNGAKHFLVISSMNANPNSKLFYPRMKGELEEELRKIPYESISILRPSLLLGEREEFRFGESVSAYIFKLIPFVFKGRLQKYKAIHGKTVALAMYKIAQKKKLNIHVYSSEQLEVYGS